MKALDWGDLLLSAMITDTKEFLTRKALNRKVC